jgi:hypothetical protein
MKLLSVLVAVMCAGSAVAGREFAASNMLATAASDIRIEPEGQFKFMSATWVNKTGKPCIIADTNNMTAKVGCVGLASVLVDLKMLPPGRIILGKTKDMYHRACVGVEIRK